MSEHSAMVSYPELVDRLEQYCNADETGTMFIKTQNTHLVRFVLDEGKIVACAYSHKSGVDALPMVERIEFGSFRFTQHPVNGIRPNALPDTRKLIRILQGKASLSEAATTQEFTHGNETERGFNKQDEMVLAKIKALLIRFIGPVGDILCNNCMQKHKGRINSRVFPEMIHEVSVNISNEQEREEFRNTAFSYLNS